MSYLSEEKIESATVTLRTAREWPEWYSSIEAAARRRYIWVLIDPLAEDAPNPIYIKATKNPFSRTPAAKKAMWRERLNLDANSEFDEESTAYQKFGEWYDDVALALSIPDVAKYYIDVSSMINRSTDANLMRRANAMAQQKQAADTQSFLRILRFLINPLESTEIDKARREYRNQLDKARQGGTNPETWIQNMQAKLMFAKTYNIPEIQGTIGSE
ncbi:hypothetical protein MCOR03_010872 [Pyricularia oryzae]|nr:hypothetical protein MCOR03_010872 [Pyricularia oryzae]KAI6600908.1 hypothetical protein MCOR06_000629 [Pyricularia oryzae]